MTVTVVTGAASGMGLACVERLRGTTEHLVAVDLHAPDLGDVVSVACDVSRPDDVARLADQVHRLGTFRALAHAAGISPTMADPRRVFAVDLIGTRLLLDALEPLVQPGSAAVCFSSVAAYQIAPFAEPELDALLDDPLHPDFLDRVSEKITHSGLAYGLAKRGVIRNAGRASLRWGIRGGRVNSLAPGIIDTPMGRQELAAEPYMQTMLAQTPLGRLGQPDEVAAVVAFLLSDGASFLSGVDVPVDGGFLQGMAGAAPPAVPDPPGAATG